MNSKKFQKINETVIEDSNKIFPKRKWFYVLCLAFGFWLLAFGSVQASTNVSSSTGKHWGWNDVIGWIDFYNTNSVTLTASVLQGYASSSAGYISFDCHTTPAGNICSPFTGNYSVTNDGVGNFSGWAWNDAYGWISFWCGNTSSCDTSSYRTTVDSSGNFRGYAWNDVIGWIDFNCDNNASCDTSDYEVQTSWVSTSTTGTLDSATYDTGAAAGAQINSITWQGDLPATTAVAFQVAVSNSSSGPWNFTGPDGTASTTWSGGNPGTTIALGAYAQYQNVRYFRYRVFLTSNQYQTLSPRVDDIIVNWSP
jgi:hypothetical protein